MGDGRRWRRLAGRGGAAGWRRRDGGERRFDRLERMAERRRRARALALRPHQRQGDQGGGDQRDGGESEAVRHDVGAPYSPAAAGAGRAHRPACAGRRPRCKQRPRRVPFHLPSKKRPCRPSSPLLRHGQSQWNLENRFTGWVDVDLSARGEDEARQGGDLMAAAGLQLDRVFASVLTRAIRTADLALAAAGQLWIPMEKDWRLIERHYGGLTGLNKAETADQYGAEQVTTWRRSYDIPPPPLALPDGPPLRPLARPALRRRRGPGHRDPEDHAGARAALLGRTHRAGAGGRPAGAGRRPRQLAARHRQAAVPGVGRGDSRRRDSHRQPPADRARHRPSAHRGALPGPRPGRPAAPDAVMVTCPPAPGEWPPRPCVAGGASDRP